MVRNFLARPRVLPFMSRTLAGLAALSILAVACTSEAAPADPRTLYTMEASAAPVAAGETGTLRIAVVPKPGSEVKAETPFRGKLQATGPLELSKTELRWDDHARVEKSGPVFEVPFRATAAGEGKLTGELTFFVCTAEACQRTTERLEVPVQVR